MRTNIINFLFLIRIKCSVELFRSRRFELFFQLFMSCSKVCNKLVTFFSKLMLISLTLLILLYFYLYLEWALFWRWCLTAAGSRGLETLSNFSNNTSKHVVFTKWSCYSGIQDVAAHRQEMKFRHFYCNIEQPQMMKITWTVQAKWI